jgi:hypothetical protein
MRIERFLGFACLTVLAGCVLPAPAPPAPPPNSHPTVSVTGGGSIITMNNTLVTVSGRSLRLSFFHDHQNPDCSLASGQSPVLNITAQASHGTLSTLPTQDFPIYPANNPMVKCSQTRIPGTALIYVSQAGYSGVDQFSYRLFLPDGKELIINSTVNITP